MPAGTEHVLDVAALLLVERPRDLQLEQLGEADDRVQRRAQLVRDVREELGLVPTDGLELLVEAPQLVVHPVDVPGERSELVAVAHLEAPGEVAFCDLGEPYLGALDRADQRLRQDEAQQRGQQDARRAHPDEQVARAGVGAPVLGDEVVRLRAGPRRQAVGDEAEVVVDVDGLGQRPLVLRAARTLAIVCADLGERRGQALVVRPDALDEHPVRGRRHEPEPADVRGRAEL